MSDDDEFMTELGQAALEEFGFSLVELQQADPPSRAAPVPLKVAANLFLIEGEFEAALTAGNIPNVCDALTRLRRLRLALETWGHGMYLKTGHRAPGREVSQDLRESLRQTAKALENPQFREVLRTPDGLRALREAVENDNLRWREAMESPQAWETFRASLKHPQLWEALENPQVREALKNFRMPPTPGPVAG